MRCNVLLCGLSFERENQPAIIPRLLERLNPSDVLIVAAADAELDAVMSAARPLPVELRDSFLRAVAHELQGCHEIGPGVVHQVCREQQRIFMNGTWPDFSRASGSSKYR